MGQYWYPVNLDKKEFVHPHRLACGLKLWEQLAAANTGRALLILTAAMPEPRGGGDLKAAAIIGRWAGDRIAVVGDYAEDGDLPKRFRASKIYGHCSTTGKYKDVSDAVCEVIEEELEGKFSGDGWREYHQKQ